MSIPDSLFQAWRRGLKIQAVRGELRVTGGEDIPDNEFAVLVDALRQDKGGVLAFLRNAALHDLEELVRGHGLRFKRLVEWDVIVPEYPSTWTLDDRAFVNNLIMSAAPISPEEMNKLAPNRTRKRALRNASEGTTFSVFRKTARYLNAGALPVSGGNALVGKGTC